MDTMETGASSRTVIRNGVWFALAGPPIGLSIALGLLIANTAQGPLERSAHWEMVPAMLPVWLSYAPIALAAAYATGGPAAFAAGAVTRYLFECGLRSGWVALASAFAAALTATLTVCVLDEFVLPETDSGKMPPLGHAIWLTVGAIAAICAVILVLAAPARPKPR